MTIVIMIIATFMVVNATFGFAFTWFLSDNSGWLTGMILFLVISLIVATMLDCAG